MNKEAEREEIEKVEKEIDLYIKENRNDLLVPSHAYISFDTYLAKEVADKYAEIHVTGEQTKWGQ